MNKLFTLLLITLISFSELFAQCSVAVSSVNENFDASTSIPTCWTTHTSGSGGGNISILAHASYSMSGINSLRMGHAGGNTADILYAVMPKVTNAQGLLYFYARTDGGIQLEVGTMSDPNNKNTFSLFQTISHGSNYQLFSVDFSTYTGSNQYIAFKYNMPGGKWTVLDNILYTAVVALPTACDTAVNNLMENFEPYNVSTLPNCWTKHSSATGGSVYVLDHASYSVSGTKSLRMGYSGSGGSATLFAVTPKLNALNGILSFQARTDGGNPLIIGTMPTADDTASFVGFDTISPINAYQLFTIDFSSYIGTDSFIVFKYEMPGGNWTVLDDINYSIGTTIQAISNTQSLSIYPNPTSSTITINTDEIIESIRIYNLNGQLVKFIAQSDKNIDIQDLTKGLYLIETQTAKGVYQNKIVKL